MFEISFKISVGLLLTNSILLFIKEFMLGGDTNTHMNGILLVFTLLFLISMIASTILYIKFYKEKETKQYKSLFYIVLITVPIVCLCTGSYVFSPLPEILSQKNM
ncbi:hypothetical protein [Staphylococcus hominis]|uniref:hypothetical protein n=1 Tax=Staphylococcus hominis TaxID=1290 RepID=UPI0011A43DF9|nr:hypothetical protein [Staphylococcus hominis]